MRPHLTAALLFVILLAAAPPLGGQGEREALLARIRTASEALEATRREESATLEEQRAALDRLRERRDRLVTERVALGTVVAELEARREAAETRRRAARRPREGGSLLAWITAARGAAADLAKVRRGATDEGLRAARELLGRDDPLESVEGVAALLGHLEDVGRRLRRPTLVNRTLSFEGRTAPAYIVTLGLTSSYFVTEDGRRAGVLDPVTGEPSPAPPAGSEESIRSALAIQRRKETPTLLLLPHRGPQR